MDITGLKKEIDAFERDLQKVVAMRLEQFHQKTDLTMANIEVQMADVSINGADEKNYICLGVVAKVNI